MLDLEGFYQSCHRMPSKGNWLVWGHKTCRSGLSPSQLSLDSCFVFCFESFLPKSRSLGEDFRWILFWLRFWFQKCLFVVNAECCLLLRRSIALWISHQFNWRDQLKLISSWLNQNAFPEHAVLYEWWGSGQNQFPSTHSICSCWFRRRLRVNSYWYRN